ncbi:hypothetical protein COCON_G00056360 [Conger conger]|uniref:Ig-like domain-containing protein n=1 Tax=Conger conger TaxID=82655 RepID=A0A9Q1DWJ5_CONCO|nr:hypothetical protein COCON_G00056360 [Conger conger]
MSCKRLLFALLIATSLLLEVQQACEYLQSGTSTTFNIGYPGPIKELIWRRKSEMIFRMKGGKQVEGQVLEIIGGSLKLSNLTASHDGTYEGEAFGNDGKSHKSEKRTICVMDKVTKPKVLVNCTGPTLTCSGVTLSPTLTFTWQQNRKEVPGTARTLGPKLKQPSRYSCTAKNQVSKETSAEIEVDCRGNNPGQSLWTLPGFEFWTTVLILAGGGTLLLVLFVVIVVCICRRQRHELNLQREEEELRLANLTHCQQPHPPGHHSRQAPPPKGHPGQHGNMHSEDQPPALPKPRGHNRPRPRPPHPQGPPPGPGASAPTAQAQEGATPRKGPRPQRS